MLLTHRYNTPVLTGP